MTENVPREENKSDRLSKRATLISGDVDKLAINSGKGAAFRKPWGGTGNIGSRTEIGARRKPNIYVSSKESLRMSPGMRGGRGKGIKKKKQRPVTSHKHWQRRLR